MAELTLNTNLAPVDLNYQFETPAFLAEIDNAVTILLGRANHRGAQQLAPMEPAISAMRSLSASGKRQMLQYPVTTLLQLYAPVDDFMVKIVQRANILSQLSSRTVRDPITGETFTHPMDPIQDEDKVFPANSVAKLTVIRVRTILSWAVLSIQDPDTLMRAVAEEFAGNAWRGFESILALMLGWVKEAQRRFNLFLSEGPAGATNLINTTAADVTMTLGNLENAVFTAAENARARGEDVEAAVVQVVTQGLADAKAAAEGIFSLPPLSGLGEDDSEGAIPNGDEWAPWPATPILPPDDGEGTDKENSEDPGNTPPGATGGTTTPGGGGSGEGDAGKTSDAGNSTSGLSPNILGNLNKFLQWLRGLGKQIAGQKKPSNQTTTPAKKSEGIGMGTILVVGGAALLAYQYLDNEGKKKPAVRTNAGRRRRQRR